MKTLEEAAFNFTAGKSVKEVWSRMDFIRGAIFGAEWQAQRMYSEDDLREAFKQSRQCKIFEKDMPPVHNEFEDWFEQFKKK